MMFKSFSLCVFLLSQEKMENKAMYLSTYEERENGSVYEEAYDGCNLSKLNLCDEGKENVSREVGTLSSMQSLESFQKFATKICVPFIKYLDNNTVFYHFAFIHHYNGCEIKQRRCD